MPPELNKAAIYAGLKNKTGKSEQSESLDKRNDQPLTVDEDTESVEEVVAALSSSNVIASEKRAVRGDKQTRKEEEEEKPEPIPKPRMQAYLLQNYGPDASICSNPVGDELGPMLYLPADQANNAKLEEINLTRALNAAAFSILSISQEINGRLQKLKEHASQEEASKFKAQNQADLVWKDIIGLQIDLEMAREKERAFENIEKERLKKLFEQGQIISKLSKENEQLKNDIETAENLANTGMINLLFELQDKIVSELKARFPKHDWSFIYSIVPDSEQDAEQDFRQSKSIHSPHLHQDKQGQDIRPSESFHGIHSDKEQLSTELAQM